MCLCQLEIGQRNPIHREDIVKSVKLEKSIIDVIVYIFVAIDWKQIDKWVLKMNGQSEWRSYVRTRNKYPLMIYCEHE